MKITDDNKIELLILYIEGNADEHTSQQIEQRLIEDEDFYQDYLIQKAICERIDSKRMTVLADEIETFKKNINPISLPIHNQREIIWSRVAASVAGIIIFAGLVWWMLLPNTNEIQYTKFEINETGDGMLGFAGEVDSIVIAVRKDNVDTYQFSNDTLKITLNSYDPDNIKNWSLEHQSKTQYYTLNTLNTSYPLVRDSSNKPKLLIPEK